MTIGDDGFGEFHCGLCSVSVYVNEKAEGRDLFGKSSVPSTSRLTSLGKTYSRSILLKVG